MLVRCPIPGFAAANPSPDSSPLTGLIYTNYLIPDVPWSIHVVKVSRTNGLYDVHSAHAGSKALGMSTLSEQTTAIPPKLGECVAAINGDFYLRDKVYAGGPRGLQVVDGELLSAPRGGVTLWINLLREPHLAKVTSRFQIVWPDGRESPFGLNAERATNGMELYTPAVGVSTHTVGGRELVLERAQGSSWLPLRMGRTCTARVREARPAGDSPLAPDVMVLSVAPALLGQIPEIEPGALLRISTDATPAVRGALTALSGGPILLRDGQAQKVVASVADAYESSSMLERHPRSAVGWNREWFFLVEVDGRQRDSVGRDDAGGAVRVPGQARLPRSHEPRWRRFVHPLVPRQGAQQPL